MNYKVINKEKYYRKDVFRHFSEDCRCSTSMTARIDVTELVHYSKKSETKFYINFLYILSKVLNSRDDYKMGYLYETNELICYDTINPTQYVFHKDTETCTPVYTKYYEDYKTFYQYAMRDVRGSRQENICWMLRIILTGLMPLIYHGYLMIHSILNFQMDIYILPQLLIGVNTERKMAGS